ncbi:MAG: ABC transporter substrate-binding protein, partial [Salinigranum sp.]
MSRDAEHSSGERGTVRGSRPTSSRRSYLKLAGASGFAGISALAGCVGGLGGGSKGPIKLGTAFPYTGPYSKEANTQKDGVNLAVDEINNDGGLMGRDLKVVDRDTELDGGTSTRRVQDLIQNEEVDLLIANLSGGISIQTNVQAKKADVPYMAGCQTVPKFHAPDNLGDGSYTPYALNVQTARADTNYIYNNIGKSV